MVLTKIYKHFGTLPEVLYWHTGRFRRFQFCADPQATMTARPDWPHASMCGTNAKGCTCTTPQDPTPPLTRSDPLPLATDALRGLRGPPSLPRLRPRVCSNSRCLHLRCEDANALERASREGAAVCAMRVQVAVQVPAARGGAQRFRGGGCEELGCAPDLRVAHRPVKDGGGNGTEFMRWWRGVASSATVAMAAAATTANGYCNCPASTATAVGGLWAPCDGCVRGRRRRPAQRKDGDGKGTLWAAHRLRASGGAKVRQSRALMRAGSCGHLHMLRCAGARKRTRARANGGGTGRKE